MMSDWIEETIRRHAVPMEPIPTSMAARTDPPLSLRAVLFDIYGTLLISGVGEVGTVERPTARAAEETLVELGCPVAGAGTRVAETLEATIRTHHQRMRVEGVDFPEVSIDRIWRETLQRLVADQVLPESAGRLDPRQVSLAYEMRVNPVWPMPGFAELMTTLRQCGIVVGVVSNAQWFTPAVVETLTGGRLAQWGWPEDLQVYSYRYGRAKPSLQLFQVAVGGLARRGIPPDEVLYVGNDMRNDCWGAGRVGFKTALFAGDARSLRLREEDPLVGDYQADWVVNDLRNLAEVLERDSVSSGTG